MPLALFIVIGVWFIDVSRLAPSGAVSLPQISAAALLLIFAFGGYDVIGVPAGEASNPRRHLPFAFVATILIVTVVMTMAQVVALGTLPIFRRRRRRLPMPRCCSSAPPEPCSISAGSVVSMTGNNLGAVLTGSRMLFALAENGELPRWFATIHPRYRTPSNAIIFTTLVALGLALSGSFVILAVASAVARLVAYTGACAATLRLRHPTFSGDRQAGDVRDSAGSGGADAGDCRLAADTRRRDERAAARRRGRAGGRSGAVFREWQIAGLAMKDKTSVFTANGEIHAQQIQGFLEAAGISSELKGESLRKTHGLTIDGLGMVEVVVSIEDEAQARALLASAEQGTFRLDDDAQV